MLLYWKRLSDSYVKVKKQSSAPSPCQVNTDSPGNESSAPAVWAPSAWSVSCMHTVGEKPAMGSLWEKPAMGSLWEHLSAHPAPVANLLCVGWCEICARPGKATQTFSVFLTEIGGCWNTSFPLMQEPSNFQPKLTLCPGAIIFHLFFCHCYILYLWWGQIGDLISIARKLCTAYKWKNLQ